MTAALDGLVGPFKTRTRQRGGEKNVEFAYYLELEIFDDGSHLRRMLFKTFRFQYFKGNLYILFAWLICDMIFLAMRWLYLKLLIMQIYIE